MRLNCKPDRPNIHDKKYAMHAEMAAPIKLFPSGVDLTNIQSAVVDQGNIGSCTGQAIAGMLECLEILELKTSQGGVEVFTFDMFSSISRLFIYYQERVIEGDVNVDQGASISDGMRAIATVGFCREDLWSYTSSNALMKPSQAAYDEAILHKEVNSYRVELDTMHQKQCLVYGYPFIASISVYDSFMWSDTKMTGVIPMPENGENLLGGHAILIVGYTSDGYFIFKNSWGTEWGLEGYGQIPITYLCNTDLTSDCWTVR